MATEPGRAEFTLTYEGAAVDEGRMAVRDLAPALLALADATREAQLVALPDTPSVSLDISSRFRAGSFDVQLILLAGIGVLTSDPVTAANNLLTLTLGSLDLLKRIGGRQIRERTNVAPGTTRITLQDGEVIETSTDRALTIERERFKEGARGVVRPVRTSDIDRMKITIGDESRLEITKQDAIAIDVPTERREATPLLESTTRMYLTVLAPAFKPGEKWRLSDGEHWDWYDILDEAFWKRVVERSDLFGNGDELICEVRAQQFRDPDGALRYERSILSVIEHRAPSRTITSPHLTEEPS